MNWWLIVLISVGGYSLLVTANNIVKDLGNGEGMNWGDFVLGGFFTWLILLTTFLVRQTKRFIKHCKYKSLIQDKEGGIYWCNSKEVNDVLEKTDFCFADYHLFIEYIKYWEVNFCLNRTTPNVRYAPKIVWKQFPKLNLKKYKEERDKNGKN